MISGRGVDSPHGIWDNPYAQLTNYSWAMFNSKVLNYQGVHTYIYIHINWLVVEPYPSEKYESQLGKSNSQYLGK
jgi:hypothetical protein